MGTGSRLPSNRERRPLLAVLAVLLIVGGAAAAGLMALRLADRTEYAYLGVELGRGQVIEQGDLRRVPMTLDEVESAGPVAAPEVMTVEEASGMIGMMSTGNYPAGTLATRSMFAKSDPFPSGYEKVGMVLTPEQAPTGLAINDQVQIWSAEDQGAAASLAGTGVVIDVGSAGANSQGGVTGATQGLHVTLLVRANDTSAVAGASGSGTAILTVTSPEDSEDAEVSSDRGNAGAR
ncbi:MAG: hypothetical protein GEU93_07435 [Propionibacteriales bacterium]|nr:hypothetical protein [Propionibacteriales bacterium]